MSGTFSGSGWESTSDQVPLFLGESEHGNFTSDIFMDYTSAMVNQRTWGMSQLGHRPLIDSKVVFPGHDDHAAILDSNGSKGLGKMGLYWDYDFDRQRFMLIQYNPIISNKFQ